MDHKTETHSAGGSGVAWAPEVVGVRDTHDGHWRYGVGVRVDLSELTKEIRADGFPFNLERASPAPAWVHGLGWALLVAVGLVSLAASWADRGVITVPTRPPDLEDDEDDSDNVIQI